MPSWLSYVLFMQTLLNIILETNVFDFALGIMFSWIGKEDLFHHFDCCSHKFSPIEIDYKIDNKKVLAIVNVFEEWHHLYEGIPHGIIVYSNHTNL